MGLLERLRHYRDQVAALVSYGNGHGSRAAAACAQLDAAAAEAPAEIERLLAEATALHEAGCTSRAAELRGEAAELDDFLAGKPGPAPVTRKGRRR
ncbi:hypothetical protein ABT297_04055 [Dactylosporangium sp. NPDC000555]|uniref:hypothetical protein n=1 Tax=Dactylosporangium sp. NPDC000555 TaxID=3154260 RepID=UPI003321B832